MYVYICTLLPSMYRYVSLYLYVYYVLRPINMYHDWRTFCKICAF